MKRLLKAILYIIIAMLLLCVVFSYFGSYSYAFELLSHFRVIYAVALVVVAIIALSTKQRIAFVVSVLAGLINAVPIVQLYFPYSNLEAEASAKTLSVLQMNIRPYQNKHYSKVCEVIEDRDADIVGVIELTSDWTKKLISTQPQYPYVFKEEGYGGIMILSKYKLLEPQIQYTGRQKRPRISTKVLVGSNTYSIILAHTVAPQNGLDLRNTELELVANEAKQADRPLIVFGDLNCSPFSYHFDRLLKSGRLLDTERGFGLQCTWSAYFVPFVPIDHVLVSKDMVCVERKVGPNIGSDHLPVFARLKLLQSGN